MRAFPARPIILVLTLVVLRPAAAQDDQQPVPPRGMMGMMQGGMMQMHLQMMEQAMNDPLRRSAMLVRVLPTMQEPLALSAEQAARLNEMHQQFEEQRQEHQEQVMQLRQQLDDLLAAEDPATDRVRSVLQEIGAHHGQMQALAYETATDMRDVLTGEQRTRLSEMAPEQMLHHMMTNMTMMEMMQAMHGGMMPGDPMGMMQGGMMNGMPGRMMRQQ